METKRKSICFISETNHRANPILDASTRYRCYHKAEEMVRNHHICAVYSADQFYKNINLEFDVYVFHRPTVFRSGFIKLFDCLLAMNKTLIADYDDLIFGDDEIAVQSSAYKNSRVSREDISRIFKYNLLALKKFSIISVSTNILAQYARKFNPTANVVVIENSISTSFLDLHIGFGTPFQNRSPHSIGYFSGSASHKHDFRMIKNALLEVLSNDAKKTLLIVGPLEIPQPFKSLSNVGLHSSIDYHQLPYLMSKCSKVIAPLEENEFNHCKSRVKFLEATISGCQLIATPIPDLEIIGESHIDFARNEDDWYQHLTSNNVIDDAGKRSNIKFLKESVGALYPKIAEIVL